MNRDRSQEKPQGFLQVIPANVFMVVGLGIGLGIFLIIWKYLNLIPEDKMITLWDIIIVMNGGLIFSATGACIAWALATKAKPSRVWPLILKWALTIIAINTTLILMAAGGLYCQNNIQTEFRPLLLILLVVSLMKACCMSIDFVWKFPKKSSKP